MSGWQMLGAGFGAASAIACGLVVAGAFIRARRRQRYEETMARWIKECEDEHERSAR